MGKPGIKLGDKTMKVGSVVLRWFGGSTMEQIDSRVQRRLRAAGKVLKNEIKAGLSKPYRGTSGLERGWPRRRTGHLRRGIQDVYNRARKSVLVGTDVPYGKHLQLGTFRMVRRPWLTLGVLQAWSKMVGVMKRGKIS
jgi:hypothetical protein